MKKRMAAAFCMLSALIILVAGCRQEPNVTSVKSHKDNETVLKFFIPFDGKSEAINLYSGIVEEYNKKNPEVEIHIEGLSTADGYNKVLEKRLEGNGSGTDLFIVNADSVKRLNEKGAFCDLSGLTAYSMLTDAAKEQAYVGDTVYTIPLQMTAYGLYVNTQILEEHGLSAPGNLDEFLNCCSKLKEAGITPISLNRWYAMTTFTMARGLYPIYQAENKEEIIAGLNDGSIKIGDYMVEGFRLFETLVKNGYYGDGITKEGTDSLKAITKDIEDFGSGKTAFFVSIFGKEALIDKENEKLKFIEQGFPVMDNGTICMPTPATRLCVSAKGEHVDEAIEAAEYITYTKAEEFAKEENGLIPAVVGEKPGNMDKRAANLYQKAGQPGQVPIEDMTLKFSCWDVVRELCLEIIDGMTPEEAAEEYNEIQLEAINN